MTPNINIPLPDEPLPDGAIRTEDTIPESHPIPSVRSGDDYIPPESSPVGGIRS